MRRWLAALWQPAAWGCEAEPEIAPAGATIEVALPLRPGLHDLVAEARIPEGASPSWAWTVDGVATAHDGPRVPVEDLAVGQTWTVRVAVGRERAEASATVPEPPGGNVVVIVLDDIGVDKLGMYGLNAQAAPTPALDALAAEGVMFRQAYASPTCSPTRAQVLTGRHGRRTGAGMLVDLPQEAWELALEALTLPEALALAPVGWGAAAVGKWHLAGSRSPSAGMHPLWQGFASFSGSPGYLPPGGIGDTEIDGYFRWRKSVDGVLALHDVYNTTDTVDDALSRLEALPEPFLLYLAFNAAHVPIHEPPAALHTRPLGPDATDADRHAAMVESMDTELARLLGGMDPGVRARTTFVVIGDNGTLDVVMEPPFAAERGKGTPYESGIRVPLLVAGPHVAPEAAGASADALVHAVDVFATVAEIAGVPLGDEGERLAVARGGGDRVVIDGQSLLPWLADPGAVGRDWLFVESFTPNGAPPYTGDLQVVRDASHKLVRDQDGELQLHTLPGPEGLDEVGGDLLVDADAEALAIRDRLLGVLDGALAEMPYEGR
jgi:arylsulfatase B